MRVGHSARSFAGRRRLVHGNAGVESVMFPKQGADHEEVRHRKMELALIASGVVVALAAGAFQYFGIVNTLESSAAASLYSQQQDIDQMFVENLDLQPYFWLGQELPDPDAITDNNDKTSAAKLVAKSEAVSYRILDHFSHLLYQMEKRAFNTERANWEAYIRHSFERSPILCRSLWDDRAAFGGEDPGSLWALYGASACSAAGTS
jgi:hypothetical protein